MRRTKEDAARTRAAIVDAALACFDRHGLAQSTLDQIAAEAGVTKGAIYHHFSNKQDIFHALREQVSLPLLDRADTTLLHGGPGTALDRIERFLAATLEGVERDRRAREALAVMHFKCEYVDELEGELADFRRNVGRLMEAFEAAYADARREGLLRTGLVPRVAAVETTMFFSGLVRLWLLDTRRNGLRGDARAAIAAHVAARRLERRERLEVAD